MTIVTSSIHIVRQYGPVGGMERYVWELTHALAAKGQKVKVLCETMHEPAVANIEVVQLGTVRPKPRWLSMLRFSSKVTQYCQQHNTDGWIIHSHERTAVHQVTTFHGPSILSRKQRLLDGLSPRLQTWEYLEERELCGSKVKVVLPNSIPVAEQLGRYYPQAKDKIAAPAYPGVDPKYRQVKKTSNGLTVGFIGKEWQRKGLEFACEIFLQYRQQQPMARFIVAGPDTGSIQHLFKGWPEDSYQLLGWCQTEDFLSKIDLLLHPAKAEPFGMVIAEANAAGIPVLISDLCGIAPMISAQNGLTLSLQQSATEWNRALRQLIQLKPDSLELNWSDLASYHEKTYSQLLNG